MSLLLLFQSTISQETQDAGTIHVVVEDAPPVVVYDDPGEPGP